jgi:hypothetical protein
MTTPSEQWMEHTLRHATDTLPLPPESRWIPERRSNSSGWTVAQLAAAALFVVAVAGAITALRLEPRVVPATEADAFYAREEATWERVRSVLPSDVTVLRPTWIPVEFRGSDGCPSPVYGSVTSRRYEVRYLSNRLPSGLCAFLDFTEVPDVRSYTGFPDRLMDAGSVNVRGTVAWLRTGTTGDSRDLGYYGDAPVLTYLWWNEGGATYEIGGINIELGDLVRVLNSLETVR